MKKVFSLLMIAATMLACNGKDGEAPSQGEVITNVKTFNNLLCIMK